MRKNIRKIAIVTICDMDNYGNRLQNLALQKIYSDFNLNVITLKNFNNQQYSKCQYYIKTLIKNILSLGVISNYIIPLFDEKKAVQYQRFRNFLKFDRNIIYGQRVFGINDKNRYPKCEYFSAGSDQIWNPNYGRLSRLDLLVDAPKDSISFSVAASFGVADIDKKQYEKVKRALSNFEAISVREKTAVELLHKICSEKKCVQLLDPTFMIKAKEWCKYEKRPKDLPDRYLAVYILGWCSPERKENIIKLAKKLNNKIIWLADINHSKEFVYGPAEFLYVIRNADLVLTDSYHATVFSIIFNVPFYNMMREGGTRKENMNSRILTLLETFKLSNRVISENDLLVGDSRIDWELVNDILLYEQKRFRNYLCTILCHE